MANSKFKIQNLKFRRLWVRIGILILLSPLGIILPDIFKSGGAWGEWGAEGLEKITGYIPQELKKLSGLWKAPIPDYEFSGWEGLFKSSIAYIISGIIGVGLVVLVSILIGKFLARKNGNS
ncbi:MAG: PDGLE domain-containing protein [Nitrospirota bacterium]